MARKRRKANDYGKNTRLDEFLSNLNIEAEKKEQIMQFVEQIAFEKLKEISTKKKQEPAGKLRLKTRLPNNPVANKTPP
ncbi:hypothetical protein HYU12_04395 [Candidatus Woesearchaeota archaeon]|nr:hypothetical protein [Candidatus Woesearchaeota archaeon]